MAKLNKVFKTTSEEASIDACGHNFLCIYGSHINGNYISIINFKVSAELSEANDIFYNKNAIANSLETVLELKDDAEVIAEELARALMPRLQIQEAQKQRNDFVR